MPPAEEPTFERTLHEVATDLGLYPIEAFRFVEEGLSYTVAKVPESDREKRGTSHISGQELCDGLREYALLQWGLLARTVLHRWNINSTHDFGRIVFAMIEAGHMRKTDQDSLDDFRDVYDFKTVFEHGYRIEQQS